MWSQSLFNKKKNRLTPTPIPPVLADKDNGLFLFIYYEDEYRTLCSTRKFKMRTKFVKIRPIKSTVHESVNFTLDTTESADTYYIGLM